MARTRGLLGEQTCAMQRLLAPACLAKGDHLMAITGAVMLGVVMSVLAATPAVARDLPIKRPLDERSVLRRPVRARCRERPHVRARRDKHGK